MIIKTFQCEPLVWERIRAKAFVDGVTCSEVIRRSIRKYVVDL